MDPMSDVLAGMHVQSFGFARLSARAPWGLSYAKHNASLGMILEGSPAVQDESIVDELYVPTLHLESHR